MCIDPDFYAPVSHTPVTPVQLAYNQMALVMVVAFINIQIIIYNGLPEGFPNSINEAFTKINN